MSASSRILVIGGAGFIGSHVVDELVAVGDEVRVLDLLHPLAHAAAAEYLNPDAEYVRGDVRDPAAVAGAVADVDAVSHQGAMVGIGVDSDDMPDYVSHNCLGTAVLLRSCTGARFDGRLVLASSMVVYGEGRYRCLEHGLVAAGAPRRRRSRRRRFEPPCTALRAPLARSRPRGRAARPAQRLRRDEARTKSISARATHASPGPR